MTDRDRDAGLIEEKGLLAERLAERPFLLTATAILLAVLLFTGWALHTVQALGPLATP